MKNSVIILVLLICCNTTTAQFLNKDATWNVNYQGIDGSPDIVISLKIEKDSLINDTVYSIFKHGYEKYALREDSNKVFFRLLRLDLSPEYGTTEHLLYDFGLELNDSIRLNLLWNEFYTKYFWKVKSVDSVLVGQEYKKRILLVYYESAEYPQEGAQYWIEDVGSTEGPLYITGISEFETVIHLFCYQVNGELLYSTEVSDGKCLTVDAGKDTTFCTGQNFNTMILGTTAKIMNGKPPFKFAWECTYRLTDKLIFTASDFLNDTTLQSPTFKDITLDQDWLKFTLTVTDSENNIARDSLFVRFSSFSYLTGGGQPWFYIEKGDSILLTFPNSGIGGGIEPLTHYWQPKTYLSDPGSVITWCKPDSSIQYEAFAIDSCGCVSAIPTVYDIRVLPKNPSHDYQTVYSNRVALFENSDNQIKALRIDSVKTAIDTVFYPFATIQADSKSCFSPYKASWIGQKVVVKPDGTNLFFNCDGDTITLKTRTRLNETWIAFQRSDDFRVKATVQSIEKENFLGLSDSVKTITLSVIDQNENTLELPLNNLKLRISKNYGFIEPLNFCLFPDIEILGTTERLENLSLAGLTNPNVGVQNLTWFEVNDFQPGDELHILKDISSWDEWNGNKIGFSIITKSILKYLKRYDYMDSIVYLVSQNQSIQTIETHTDTITYNCDTTILVIKPDPQFDKLPGEPIIDEWKEVTNYLMENTDVLSKLYPGVYESIHHVKDSCWAMAVVDGCFKYETYFKGFGGPYYTCSNCCSSGGEKRKLVYYKKGETEWGEKLVITGVSEIKVNSNLKFFPNPAESFITISSPSNLKIKKIELIDISGRIVQMWNAADCAGNTLSIQNISPGVYLLKAETDAGIKTEKLVVH